MDSNVFQNGLVVLQISVVNLAWFELHEQNCDQLHRRDWRMLTSTSPSAHVSAKIRINTKIIPGFAHAKASSRTGHMLRQWKKTTNFKRIHDYDGISATISPARYNSLSKALNPQFLSCIKWIRECESCIPYICLICH